MWVTDGQKLTGSYNCRALRLFRGTVSKGPAATSISISELIRIVIRAVCDCDFGLIASDEPVILIDGAKERAKLLVQRAFFSFK